MTEQKPLSDAEREDVARELTDEQFMRAPAVDRPKAIFTAGQPGSGKSMIVNSVSVKFEGVGERPVRIDPDLVRPELPYMQERIERGDLEIPGAAFSDAGTIAARMMEMAAEGRRNIVYDGTLSNSFYALKSVEHLKSYDYQVEIHGMAVAPDLSHASTYDRREDQIRSSPTRFGRGVGDDFHDQAVAGLVKTIETLQAEGKVDAIVLYDRQGNIVGSTRYQEGQWVPDEKMADTLRNAHEKPDQKTLQDAASTWDRAAAAMRDRGADPDEQRKVDSFRDAAAARVSQPVATTPAERAAQFDGACAGESKAIVEKAIRIEARLEERREVLQQQAAATDAAKPAAPRWIPGAGKAADAWQEQRERIDRQIAATTGRIERVAPFTQAPVPGYPSAVETMAVRNVERKEPELAREAIAFRTAERQAQARAFSEARTEQQSQAKKLSR